MARHPSFSLSRLALPLALALAAAPALAQQAQPAAPAHAQAEEQFRQGREAQNKGDFQRALDLFRASEALEPGRGKLINMAICEEKLGLPGSALRHLDEVLPQLPPGDERLPIVQKRLAQLRTRAPMLRLDLAPGTPDRARVELDGAAVPAAQLAAEIPVDPGKHTVTLTAEGRAAAHQDVELKEQEHRTLRLEAGASLGAPAAGQGPLASEAPAPDAPEPGARRRTVGLATGGIGVAMLVIGAGTGIASLVDHGAAVSGCPTHLGCSQSVLDDASRGKALAVASTVTFITGAALVGVGAYLVLSGGPAQPKAAVGLVGLPGGARLEGRF
jgi:hypothetical protein